jgi:hypothetical protein
MKWTYEDYQALKTVPYFAAASRSGSSHIARCTSRIMNIPVQAPRFLFAGEFSTDDHQVDPAAILKAYNAKPMIIIRNLFDSLVSVKEQMEVSQNMTCPGVPRPEYQKLSEDEKWDWISFNIIPWYFQFYASWHYADIDKLLIHYRDFYSENNFKVMSKILDWIGFPNPGEKRVAELHARRDARFNIGQSGRGKAIPEIVKERAYQQAKTWGPLEKALREELLD